jgi:hypothetical protein
MEIKVLGVKVRVEIVVACVLLGMLIHALLFCSCVRVNVREGMQMLGAALNHKMGEGVQGSWDTRQQAEGSSLKFRAQDHDSYSSKFVGPEQALNYFSDTEFKPECCGSTYSANGGLLREQGYSSGGCACMSKKQVEYINSRGGNRTLNTEY